MPGSGTRPVGRREGGTALNVIVIGGGQAGLAAGYHLRRAGVDFTILDAQPEPGGAWLHGWDSLRLFSPARHSSLPGWPMPRFPHEGYPTADHVVDYLASYEKRYELPVERSVRVRSVRRVEGGYDVDGRFADAVISATGTWWRPFIPAVARDLPGRHLHTVQYRNPQQLAGQRVVVVGGGNSGAQIAADLADHVDLTWITRRPPRYLPDEIDGKALFGIATQWPGGVGALGDIVAVPPVRDARDRGLLVARPMDRRLVADADTVIWCTGFRPALDHLAPLNLRDRNGHVHAGPRLHPLGYGDWTGPASATLIGVGPTARAAVAELVRT
ncbi:cation diffusion facilitator CzcD-associated flavoprotein CzcO [Saccharothrix ecbatanensis]|uniref:Cation diffusion facilitator CzcD-associated flavoprotein CzcO n=1 Tax=Saccharothrix ecbatanensis TaxID=1105145 RepID=A0A7W9HGU4_9PSEU|nr:ArsO family NAD(P)H-dependent flavin-containing monooxygenase [Saccharothrix ecbatanensis]MBB5802022.1 cation diffusion facilitator CzcD-associated flavoprotein CzcO [Saccharothrix ecbatanensis]